MSRSWKTNAFNFRDELLALAKIAPASINAFMAITLSAHRTALYCAHNRHPSDRDPSRPKTTIKDDKKIAMEQHDCQVVFDMICRVASQHGGQGRNAAAFPLAHHILLGALLAAGGTTRQVHDIFARTGMVASHKLVKKFEKRMLAARIEELRKLGGTNGHDMIFNLTTDNYVRHMDSKHKLPGTNGSVVQFFHTITRMIMQMPTTAATTGQDLVKQRYDVGQGSGTYSKLRKFMFQTNATVFGKERDKSKIFEVSSICGWDSSVWVACTLPKKVSVRDFDVLPSWLGKYSLIEDVMTMMKETHTKFLPNDCIIVNVTDLEGCEHYQRVFGNDEHKSHRPALRRTILYPDPFHIFKNGVEVPKYSSYLGTMDAIISYGAFYERKAATMYKETKTGIEQIKSLEEKEAEEVEKKKKAEAKAKKKEVEKKKKAEESKKKEQKKKEKEEEKARKEAQKAQAAKEKKEEKEEEKEQRARTAEEKKCKKRKIQLEEREARTQNAADMRGVQLRRGASAAIQTAWRSARPRTRLRWKSWSWTWTGARPTRRIRRARWRSWGKRRLRIRTSRNYCRWQRNWRTRTESRSTWMVC